VIREANENIRYTENMKEVRTAGFSEIEHTADVQVEIWAPDLPELFRQAALGMYSIAQAQLNPEPRVHHAFTIRGEDPESLLVSYLSELIFLAEQTGIGLDQFDFMFEEPELHVKCEGALIQTIEKAIKAVTYHNLQIHWTGTFYRASVVFDV
jgi:SHS2 domain-containing protein